MYNKAIKKTNHNKAKEDNTMKTSTINAIQKYLDKGETRFHIAAYYYVANVNGTIRRREQVAGRTPTSGWELVVSWNPNTWKVIAE